MIVITKLTQKLNTFVHSLRVWEYMAAYRIPPERFERVEKKIVTQIQNYHNIKSQICF